jgi:hypothetical protein
MRLKRSRGAFDPSGRAKSASYNLLLKADAGAIAVVGVVFGLWTIDLLITINVMVTARGEHRRGCPRT